MTFSPLLASLVSAMLAWALLLLSLFLILLILVQRGRGGGLTGALGGPGGQSAFGTKAGDLFTRITSFVALGWIALCAFTMWLIGSHAPSAAVTPAPTVSASPADESAATSEMIDLGGGTSLPADQLTPLAPAEPAVDLQPPAVADPAPAAAERPQAAREPTQSAGEPAAESEPAGEPAPATPPPANP